MFKVTITYSKLSGLLNQAFSNYIFPRPNKGELLVGLDINKQVFIKDMNLYFQEEYYNKIISKIDHLNNSPEILYSNAKNEWLKLFNELKIYEKIDTIQEDTIEHMATNR